jgi:Homeodomain-like domain
MPKLLRARASQDAAEEQKVRKLANSRHAPGDWIMRARMIACSWDGRHTKAIADELGCHPQTVRHWTLDALTAAARERGIADRALLMVERSSRPRG